MKKIKGSTLNRIKYAMEMIVYALLIVTFIYWAVLGFTNWLIEKQNELHKQQESGIISNGRIVPKNIGEAFQ